MTRSRWLRAKDLAAENVRNSDSRASCIPNLRDTGIVHVWELAKVQAAKAEKNLTTSASSNITRRMIIRDLAQLDTSRGSSEDSFHKRPNGSFRKSSLARPRPDAPRGLTRSLQEASSEDLKGSREESARVVAMAPGWMIMPYSKAKHIWDALVFVAMLIDTMSSTYLVAFADGAPAWLLLTLDCCFLGDMVRVLLTGYVHPHTSAIVTDLRVIAKRCVASGGPDLPSVRTRPLHLGVARGVADPWTLAVLTAGGVHWPRRYALSKLPLDTIAVLPLWYVNRHFQLLRLCRLHYLTHMMRDVPITSKYYHTYDICMKLLLFVVLLHITSCIHYLIADTDGVGAALDSEGCDSYVWTLYITFALLLGDAELGERLGLGGVEHGTHPPRHLTPPFLR